MKCRVGSARVEREVEDSAGSLERDEPDMKCRVGSARVEREVEDSAVNQSLDVLE